MKYIYARDHFVDAPSQWETTLRCDRVSHWLGSFTKWSLLCLALFHENLFLTWFGAIIAIEHLRKAYWILGSVDFRVKPTICIQVHHRLILPVNKFFLDGHALHLQEKIGHMYLTRWSWDKMATILQMQFWKATFLNENVSILIKISLKCVPKLVHGMTWCLHQCLPRWMMSPSLNSSPPGQNGRHSGRRHFQTHFREWKVLFFY